jgi:hypothetical protein
MLLINFVLLPICVLATETADDYFNYGAQDYIFGEKEKAMKQVVTGLQLYPQDPKLNSVIRLLKRPPPTPQKNNKPKKGDQGEKNDQQNSKQDQAKNDKQKEQDKQKQAQQAKPSDKREEKPENMEASAADQMSPEEAKQLLDSQQENEKILIFAPSNQPVSTLAGKIKDW